jgi:LmbE family N-acetylglucosaminyl deacetylase
VRAATTHAWWRDPAVFWPRERPRAAFLSPSSRCAATSTPSRIAALTALVRRFQPHVVVPNLDREIRLAAAASRAARALRPRPLRPRLIPRRGSEFPLKNKRHYRIVYTADVDRVIVNSEATKRTMMRDAPWFGLLSATSR